MHRIFIFSLLTLCVAGRGAASADTPVATVAHLEFHSAFWVNLHHTLYAAAWAQRPDASARRLIGPLPAALTGLSRDEQAAWDAAVRFYDAEIADRDLRSGRDMTFIKRALATEDLAADVITPALRATLEQAAPIYRRRFWPAHDRSNRNWIQQTSTLLRSIEQEIVASHERLYGRPWFSTPVRVDIVWVGRAYTTLDPVTHATVSPAEGSGLASWTGVEMVLHEVSHELILPTEESLRRAGDEAMWHTIQFYMTGQALQQVLEERGIDYTPYMYSTGLFDRAWGQYRKPIEDHWGRYVRGEITRAQAIADLVAAVAPKPQ